MNKLNTQNTALNSETKYQKLSKTTYGQELIKKLSQKVMGVDKKTFINNYFSTFYNDYEKLTIEKIKSITKNPDNFVFKIKNRFLNKKTDVDLSKFQNYLQYLTPEVLKNINSNSQPHTLESFKDILPYFENENDLLTVLKDSKSSNISNPLESLVYFDTKNKFKTKNQRLTKFFKKFNENLIPNLAKPYISYNEFAKILNDLGENLDSKAISEIYPADIKTQIPDLNKITKFLNYFNLTQDDHMLVLSKRFINSENFIFYDVEVTPFVWSITFAKINSGKIEWSYFYGANTLNYDYLGIKNNPYNRLQNYIQSNLDYVLIGWYSDSYDTYILRTLLSGQNPWLMNEFLINFNDYFKHWLKDNYSEHYEVESKKTNKISLKSNKDIKSLTPRNLNMGYYINSNTIIRGEEIIQLYLNWLLENYGKNSQKYPYFNEEFLDFKTNEPNKYIQEYYQDLLSDNMGNDEKIKKYLEEQLKNLFSQYLNTKENVLVNNKYNILEYDLLKSKVWKDKTGNTETRSLKSLGAYLGTSIEEKAIYFNKFNPLSKEEVADLLDYNSKDVTLTVVFGNKITKHILFEMEKLLTSYELLFDIIEEQKKLREEGAKTSQNFNYKVREPKDVILPWNSYGMTDATLTGKFLTLNGRKPNYNQVINEEWNYTPPKAVWLLKEQMGKLQQKEYQRAIDMFTSLNGMKMFEMMKSFKLWEEMELQNVNNAGYKIQFGGGGTHAAYSKYFLEKNFWMSDYRAFYPNLMLIYKFFPKIADIKSYKEIKIRRETLKIESAIFKLEFNVKNLPKIKQHIKEFRKMDFLDDNVFQKIKNVKNNDDLLLWLNVNKKAIKVFSKSIYFYVEFLKLILNTVYGTTNDENSLIFNPKSTFGSTFTGQLLVLGHLLMIDPYIKVIQTNTDANYYIPYEKETIQQLNKKFEEITQINIETEEGDVLIQRDVNNYLTFVKKELKNENNEPILDVNDKPKTELIVKKGTGAFGRYPNHFMNLENGILTDNKIPIIEEGIIKSFLGVSPEETIQKAIDEKQWWKFALIGKKGNGFDALVEIVEDDHNTNFNIRAGNTFRAFPVYNGINIAKYKTGEYLESEKHTYNKYQFIKNNVFYKTYSKVTNIPNGIWIYDGDLDKIDDIKINARFYINKIKNVTSEFNLKKEIKFGKITKNILNIMKKNNEKLLNINN